jgi:soluble lytic murein transglycosylase-like protein
MHRGKMRSLILALIFTGGMLMPSKSYYISNETIECLRGEGTKAIEKYSKQYTRVPKALMKAIIKQESGWNYHAFRVDYSVLKRQSWYKKTLSLEQRQYKVCYASYGLDQILFGLARHYGFKGSPRELFAPDTNVKYGFIHLDYLLKRYKGNIKDAIHAYNWGSDAFRDTNGNKVHDEGEDYKNQDYVDNVLKFYESYGGTL